MCQFFDITLGQLLEDNVGRYPDHEALVYSDRDLRYTFTEFNERVDNVAKGFLAIGLGKGDHIALWATNVPDWLVVNFAAAKIGAVLVTVNTNYRSSELDYILKQSDAKALASLISTGISIMFKQFMSWFLSSGQHQGAIGKVKDIPT